MSHAIGVVVVTHGQLATELVNSAEMIVGDLTHFTAVSIGWHEDTEDAREEIAQAIARVRQDGGVLILTDMFGGTPSNLAISVMEQTKAEVIAGLNLPMLIKLASVRTRQNLEDCVACAQEAGRKYISVASYVLAGEK